MFYNIQAVLSLHGFLNNMIYFGTLICPFSTKSLFRLHGFLLTRFFFQSLKKHRKQRTPCVPKVLLNKILTKQTMCSPACVYGSQLFFVVERRRKKKETVTRDIRNESKVVQQCLMYVRHNTS